MLKLIGYTLSLYVCFVIWGFLQEKITSKVYADQKWEYPFTLNLLMAFSCYALPLVLENVITASNHDIKDSQNKPAYTLRTFWLVRYFHFRECFNYVMSNACTTSFFERLV